MRRRCASIATALALFTLSVAATELRAQSQWSLQDTQPDSLGEQRVVIELVDGSVIHALFVSATDDRVVVRSAALGRLEVPRDQIASMSFPKRVNKEGEIWRDDPDYNSIALVPTSETLPRGRGYYRNYEIFFNTIGVAITDNFNISAMATFPVAGSAYPLMVGGKLRLLSRERAPLGLALTGSMLVLGDEKLASGGAVVSVGNRRRTLSAAINLTRAFDNSGTHVTEAIYMLGGDIQVGRGTKFLFEYGVNNDSLVESSNDDFRGLINIGFKMFWNSTSFALTGARPLSNVEEEFIAFPLLIFSSHF